MAWIHEISQGYSRSPACSGKLGWHWVTIRRMGNPLKYWRVFRTLSKEVLCVLALALSASEGLMEDTGPVFTRIIYWPWNWANWFRYFQYFRWSNQTFLSRKDFRRHSGSQAAGLEQIKVWGHSVPDRRSSYAALESCCWPGGGRCDFFFSWAHISLSVIR